MQKTKIVKATYGGKTYYQIKQRHFIFFWWWVDAWINSTMGALAPIDTFETLEEAQKNLYKFQKMEYTEEDLGKR